MPTFNVNSLCEARMAQSICSIASVCPCALLHTLQVPAVYMETGWSHTNATARMQDYSTVLHHAITVGIVEVGRQDFELNKSNGMLTWHDVQFQPFQHLPT